MVECFEKISADPTVRADRQYELLLWLMDYYLDPNIDSNPFNNFRVIVVERILMPVLRLASQPALVRFFNEHAENLMNGVLKQPINPMLPYKEIIMAIQLKKAAFEIV